MVGILTYEIRYHSILGDWKVCAFDEDDVSDEELQKHIEIFDETDNIHRLVRVKAYKPQSKGV